MPKVGLWNLQSWIIWIRNQSFFCNLFKVYFIKLNFIQINFLFFPIQEFSKK